jgi:hypothetical protein
MGTVQARTGRSVTSTLLERALVLREGEKFVDARILDNNGNLVTDKFDVVQRLIAGVLIYLTWSNADELLAEQSKEYRDWIKQIKRLKGSKRARKMKLSVSQAERTTTRYLSISVVDRHSEEDSEPGTKTHASPAAHHRCGHFRAQPYGPKSDPMYKTIWIKPQMIGKGNCVRKDKELPNVKVVR